MTDLESMACEAVARVNPFFAEQLAYKFNGLRPPEAPVCPVCFMRFERSSVGSPVCDCTPRFVSDL